MDVARNQGVTDRRPRLLDAAVVLVLVGVVTANTALAPSNTMAHSQWRQMGAAVGTLRSGQWLLPRNQVGEVPSKGPLMTWLMVPALAVTGVYSDLVYRIPSVAAGLAMGLMVYLLGCRWYGRRAGLLAGALWATNLHMGHLIYLCTTDMLVTLWMTLSIFCADRLLFHREAGQRDRLWAMGLWGSMILAGMTKGWGLMNLVLVGGMVALATAAGPGFGALGRARGAGEKVALAGRLVVRRWLRAARMTGAGWGLPAFVGAMAVLLGLMLLLGREAFGGRFAFEIVGRIFGGEDAPRRGKAPPVLAFLYYCLPSTLFMVAGLTMHPLRRWLARRSPTCLPLCWVLSVVVPYSFTHGFRPDYLLACYAAAALLGAAALESLAALPAQARTRGAGALRHFVAAGPVILGLTLIAIGSLYAYRAEALAACQQYAQGHGSFAGAARRAANLIERSITPPPFAGTTAWWLCRALPMLGVGVVVFAIQASLRWDIRRLALVTVVGMLGALFADRHFMAEFARSGDGENALTFARGVERRIGNDPFAVHQASILVTEPYLGRFGTNVQTLEHLRECGARWLVTTDASLLKLCRPRRAAAPATGEVWIGRSALESAIEPLGRLEYMLNAPIDDSRRRGERMILVRLNAGR